MASSSTSSVQKGYNYDVFLSFRGEDTRKNFVDHLYAALDQQGIRTFKDDERLEKGKRIDEALLMSIENSKFFIVVFSKNYASSSWCLDELVKIIECHDTADQTAFPVFYDVEPSEVRKQSGAVEKAFARFDNDGAAGKWRDALKQAANLSGWDLRNTADGHEAKVIKLIVERISLELRSIYLSDDGKLVGMESRIKQIESSLKTHPHEVCMIGIKGMGGAGKTTLARAVFDILCIQFEGRSFIENVREVSKSSMSGLKSLQEKVLSDVLNEKDIKLSTIHDGKGMMKMRLRGKKVLVVLDDVDHIDQLEALAGEPSWFKTGSIIIITTRDEQVLKSHRVNLIHDVNLLLSAEAICLFSRYAFGREIPIQGYQELSREVICYAAGLPLTIKVLGSFLCGKNKLEWKDALDRLKKIPLKETLEKLELSYISLEDDYKEIFLDVACLLKGFTKDKAIRMLESCGFHAKNGLRVLEQKSLITINKYGCLDLHDHIEEMGRNIVRRRHPDEHYKHTRLWILKEIQYVLANELGTNATRCICVHSLILNPETFIKGLNRTEKLRVLDMCSTSNVCSDWKFDDDSQYFPNSLQYLRWEGYPFLSLPKTFQANNLVTLEMPFSNIIQLSDGKERKVFNNLTYLDLSKSNLKKIDIGLTPNLEVLRLERCYHLEEFHMIVGNPKLRTLSISYTKLRSLDLRPTPNLQKLSLEECDELVELHMPIGLPELTFLELKMFHSKLKTLDLGLSLKLKELIVVGCNDLVELHMPFNGCPKLTYLKLHHSKLRTLDLRLTPDLYNLDLKRCHDLVELRIPDNGLSKLTCLRLKHSKLKTLDLRLIPKLAYLRLDKCHALAELHMSIKGCPELTSIYLLHLKLKTIHLGLTPNLKGLTISECDELVELHMPINGCPEIISINLYHSKLKTLDLGFTPKLEVLYLDKCHYLEELRMPINPMLTMLYINSSKLKTFDLGLTPNLKELTLKKSHNLVEIRMPINGCPELTSLYLEHSKLKTLDLGQSLKLEKLTLKECYNLVELNTSDGFLEELAYLDLSGGSLIKSFFLNKQLGSLEFHLTAESQNMFPLHSEPGLQKFELSGVFEEQLYSSTGDLQKFISLALSRCTKFGNFSESICRLPHLRHLSPEWGIPEAPNDLYHLECLEKLYLLFTEISQLSDSICMLKHLKSLVLVSHMHLEELPKGVGQLDCLEVLHWVSTRIEHLPGSICLLKQLKSLILEQCGSFENLPEDIGQLECLENLYLLSMEIKHLPDSICMLKHLKSLVLVSRMHLENLPEDIGQLECLEMLYLVSTRIKHLPDSICLLKQLKYLILDQCSSLEKLPGNIGRLECLEKLHLFSMKIKHLPDTICMLKHLKHLVLVSCMHLEKLPDNIDELERLEVLRLASARIKHLPVGICLLKHLKSLILEQCASLENLPGGVSQLECLEELFLSSAHIKHLPDSICLLKHLKFLTLAECPSLEKLPEDIGQLECLTMLHLVSTRIKHLPHSIFLLKRLESHVLDQCGSLEKLPEDVGQLECLEELFLSSAHIKHLPVSICLLKFLTLAECPSLEKLPEDISQLRWLERLHLSSTPIKHLPVSICLLKHLKSLRVEYSLFLEKLPDDLGQLQCLEDLIITECKHLQDIPNSISKLKFLKWFHLSYCPVEKLPEDIGHLICLKGLNIEGTSIGHLPQSIFMLKGVRIVGDTRLFEMSGYPFESALSISEDVTSCYI